MENSVLVSGSHMYNELVKFDDQKGWYIPLGDINVFALYDAMEFSLLKIIYMNVQTGESIDPEIEEHLLGIRELHYKIKSKLRNIELDKLKHKMK